MTILIQSPTQLDVLKSIQAERHIKGQCFDYPGLPHVETFFKVKLRLPGQLSHIITQVSSGKYLHQKRTQISVINNHGDTLSFGFHDHKIRYLVKGKEEEINCTPDGNPQAYENVLESLYLGNHDLFVSPAIAMEALRIITPMLNQDAIIHKYEKGWNPD